MPKAGRPREFDRKQALETAMLLFWRKGFTAASVTDLCEAMDIRAPSLYAAFGNKEALFHEAFEYYVGTFGARVMESLGKGATAREGVEGLLQAWSEMLPAAGTKPSSCMATLAGVGDEWPAALAEQAKRVRLQVLKGLRTRLKAGVADGELPSVTDIERLSRFYLTILQGMAIQARDGATRSDLKGIALSAMAAWPAG